MNMMSDAQNEECRRVYGEEVRRFLSSCSVTVQEYQGLRSCYLGSQLRQAAPGSDNLDGLLTVIADALWSVRGLAVTLGREGDSWPTLIPADLAPLFNLHQVRPAASLETKFERLANMLGRLGAERFNREALWLDEVPPQEPGSWWPTLMIDPFDLASFLGKPIVGDRVGPTGFGGGSEIDLNYRVLSRELARSVNLLTSDLFLAFGNERLGLSSMASTKWRMSAHDAWGKRPAPEGHLAVRQVAVNPMGLLGIAGLAYVVPGGFNPPWIHDLPGIATGDLTQLCQLVAVETELAAALGEHGLITRPPNAHVSKLESFTVVQARLQCELLRSLKRDKSIPEIKKSPFEVLEWYPGAYESDDRLRVVVPETTPEYHSRCTGSLLYRF